MKETGGKLFYNRNDVDGEIRDAQALGSASYTLTDRPPADPADGSFGHIEVPLRDPSPQVLTKAGYFGPVGNEAVDTQHSELVSLADAAQSTIPSHTLEMTVRNLVRHPDSGTVQFTIALRSSRLLWNRGSGAASTTDATFAAISLSKQRDILASSLKMLTITAHAQDPRLLPATPDAGASPCACRERPRRLGCWSRLRRVDGSAVLIWIGRCWLRRPRRLPRALPVRRP